jgi:hypothetical protein
MITACFSAYETMKDRSLAPAESIELAGVIRGHKIVDRYRGERNIARFLDRKNLASHSVLVDSFRSVPIILSSQNPGQFLVITSDRDFRVILPDPGVYGVKFILAEPKSGLGKLDAVNRMYPALYAHGGGFAKLLHEFVRTAKERPAWRLYRIVGTDEVVRSDMRRISFAAVEDERRRSIRKPFHLWSAYPLDLGSARSHPEGQR